MIVRVLVVDDYQPWLRYIRSMLHEAREFHVIGEASDGAEAVEKAAQLEPDLILLDIGLPTLNGIEAARRIREHRPDTTILFVSEQRSQDVVGEAMSTGSGYVLKSCATRELFPAIKTVIEGRRFVSTSLYGQNLTDSKGALAQPAAKTVENRHEVNYYPDQSSFVDSFARFLGKALENGSTVVLLASDSRRVGILQRLKSDGVNVAAAIEQERYFPLDSPDGSHTFEFTEDLATSVVNAARERNLPVAVG